MKSYVVPLILYYATRVVVTLQTTGLNQDKIPGWTSADYPDIRAKPWTDQCGKHVPQFGYVCDPSPEAAISRQEAYLLNEMLIDLAKNTKCKCQRRSQCMTKFHSEQKPYFDPSSNSNNNNQLLSSHQKQVQIGFVAAVAFVHKLSNQGFSTAEATAEKFSKIVRTRWGLGDCGNMVLILVWDERQLVYISMDEDKTALYLTRREADRIVASVQDKIQNREYLLGLEHILRQVKLELDGEPEKFVDIGILALAVSSGVAVVVVGIITMCVCAFRCCGNLQNAPLKEAIERVENLKAEFRSLNRSNNNNNGFAAREANYDQHQQQHIREDLYTSCGKNKDILVTTGDEESLPSSFLDGKHSLV